jgi:hypothetical protein
VPGLNNSALLSNKNESNHRTIDIDIDLKVERKGEAEKSMTTRGLDARLE